MRLKRYSNFINESNVVDKLPTENQMTDYFQSLIDDSDRHFLQKYIGLDKETKGIAIIIEFGIENYLKGRFIDDLRHIIDNIIIDHKAYVIAFRTSEFLDSKFERVVQLHVVICDKTYFYSKHFNSLKFKSLKFKVIYEPK